MFQDLFSGVPLVRVPDQQVLNEILGLCRDLSPVFVDELKFTILNALKELVLALLAHLSLLPATVTATMTIEGRVTTQQDVEDDAQTPQITALVIGPRLVLPYIYHLRGHELS